MNVECGRKAIVARRRLAVLSCAIAMAMGLSSTVRAQTVGTDNAFHFGLEGGVEYTDNVSRSSVDEESETVGIAALTLGITADRPRLDTDIAAHLEYHKYMDDTYDNELVGGVDALASYAFIPERFVWVLTDNFAQIAEDLSEVDTPDNRENVNYLSTGPDFTVPLGRRTSVQLSGRYSDTYYEEREEDSQALTGSLALVRQISPASALSLNGSTTEVDYDEELFSDYQIKQGFLRWSTTTERTTFTLDGGYNSVEIDGGDESDGPLAHLTFTRLIGSRSNFGLTAGTAYETPGESLRRNQDQSGIDLGADDSIVAGDAYQLDYAYVSWGTDWTRTSLTMGLNARSEEHEVDVDANRDMYGATFRVSRQTSRRMDLDLRAAYTKEDLSNIDFSFDEWSVGAGLRWQASERVALRLTIDHIEGSSDDGTRDFDENRAYLGVTYSRTR